VLLFGTAQTASAQAFSCVAAASPTIMRAEGVADLTGDIVLNCTGGTPTGAGVPVPLYTLNVQLNTNITNRILETTTNFTDAVLIIDNATTLNFDLDSVTAGNQIFSLAATPINGVVPNGDWAAGTQRNAYLGRRVSDNTVAFGNVALDPSATTRTITIRNIRANGSGIAPAFVTAFLSTSGQAGAAPLAVTNNVLNVGSPQAGATFAGRNLAGTEALSSSGLAVDVCVNVNNSLLTGTVVTTAPTSGVFAVRFSEQQVAGFKTAVQEQSPVFVGVVNTGTPSPANLGAVTNGTRLRVIFNNVPAGLGVFVTTTAITSPETDATVAATYVSTLDPAGAGGTVAVPSGTQGPLSGSTFVRVPVTGTTGTAVWEITTSDTAALEDISFGVVLASAANATTVGQGTMNGSLAPIGTPPHTMSATAPIPRFVDTSTASNFANVRACRTNLLYPFVINQAGYNTGIAIVNTSQDSLSSSNAQSGRCTINYHGVREGGAALPPATATTDPIAAGRMVSFTVMDGGSGIPANSGFLGYMIAQCDFRFGHGFAFVSDLGVTRVAMGYLALVLDTGTGRSGISTSESLGQ
jgi:hypothetical protein